MDEFIFRTEELTNKQVIEWGVLSKYEEGIVDKLKAASPVLLVGSRGVGKTFLFKMAEIQMQQEFEEKRILPVMLTFRKASLLKTGNEYQFQYWMLGRICSELLRTIKKIGKFSSLAQGLFTLTGKRNEQSSKIDEIVQKFEESWRSPGVAIDAQDIPTLDDFLDTVEDLCEELDIARIVLFIDEAAHVFYPEQQRQFFTLFRDLRSPYIKCNAAVYPGVTVYGDTFEPVHDALKITLTRNVNDENYVTMMKEMVMRQVKDSSLATRLSKNGSNFTLLAYAASGNPRYLLKSVELANKMDSNSINEVFREYYRGDLWSEHTKLAERYPGYQKFIDWGRDFIETNVIPEIKSKNDSFLQKNRGKGTTLYFWIHKNAPQEVKESLRILEYSGLVYEEASGIRATRSEVGTRYMVNIGCLVAMEAKPASTGLDIMNNADIRRMNEYGANHPLYKTIQGAILDAEIDSLKIQLDKSIDILDLTEWQKKKMHEIQIHTIGALISASEERLKQARQIADVRARNIKNAGIAAVCEYLLG
ncbi:hypothetical protein [Clostridium sp. AM33-3]|uniref:ORC-CDC6 family AAA ATPase n=1 Tax=Clostridium sp. AM33-3 TaxID=2292304 RepID=UPI000E4BFC69|nr:hypothetical protein [Clostridium sp. AM33-3]RHT17741.1 hypothetical protein DW819_14115 [Clostridium sp. AM33-3]